MDNERKEEAEDDTEEVSHVTDIEVSLSTMLSLPDTIPTEEECCRKEDFHRQELEEEMFYNKSVS